MDEGQEGVGELPEPLLHQACHRVDGVVLQTHQVGVYSPDDNTDTLGQSPPPNTSGNYPPLGFFYIIILHFRTGRETLSDYTQRGDK